MIYRASPSLSTKTLASEISLALEDHGYDTTVFTWGSDTSKLSGQPCISLLELEEPLLYELSAYDLSCIKQILLETSSFLWITAFDEPSAAMIDGLTRVVRNETPGLALRTLHAGRETHLSAGCLAQSVIKVFLSKTQDEEFRLKDGHLQTSRVMEDVGRSQEITNLLPDAPQTVSRLTLGQASSPLKFCIQSPGMLDSICMTADESARSELEPDFIEIQVKATALK